MNSYKFAVFGSDISVESRADAVIRQLYCYGWQYEFVGGEPPATDDMRQESDPSSHQLSSFDRVIYYYVYVLWL